MYFEDTFTSVYFYDERNLVGPDIERTITEVLKESQTITTKENVVRVVL